MTTKIETKTTKVEGTTVKQLIKKLREFDGDMVVVLSSDEEGNSFQRLSNFENPSLAWFVPEQVEDRPSVLLEQVGEEDKEEKDATECVVLWP